MAVKATALTIGILTFACSNVNSILRAQDRARDLDQFEVASIRPSVEKTGRPSLVFTPGGGVRASNVTVKLLIEAAYDIRSEQLSGGPAWADSEEFTIVAKGPDGSPVLSEPSQTALNRKRLRAMLRDRFHLDLKKVTLQAPGYVLTVTAKGHTMTQVEGPGYKNLHQLGRWQVRAEGVPMSTLAGFLGTHLHASVVDETGLDGLYSFQLNWNPGLRNGEPLSAAEERAVDSLLEAVPAQLGLRVARKKVATEQYTIERVEKPSE